MTQEQDEHILNFFSMFLTEKEKKELEYNNYVTGLERFYSRFGHAQSLGYDWDYHPPEHYFGDGGRQ